MNITLASNVQQPQQPNSRTSSPAMDGHALAAPTITSLGNCRTCLKRIKENEEHHYCDNCSQIICEDCSSYSGKYEAKVRDAVYQTVLNTAYKCFALDASDVSEVFVAALSPHWIS